MTIALKDKLLQNVLVLPRIYCDIDENEITYIEGGTDYFHTAQASSNFCAANMTAWSLMAMGYSWTAAAAAVPTAGIGSVFAGVGAGYCAVVASMFVNGYNQAQDIIADYGSNQLVRTRVNSFFSLITSVNVTKM